MRIAALLVLLPSIAHADSGVSLDFGYLHSRVAVADDTTVAGGVGRFAIGIAFKRHFHAGAEAEEGWLSGTTSLPDGAVARTPISAWDDGAMASWSPGWGEFPPALLDFWDVAARDGRS